MIENFIKWLSEILKWEKPVEVPQPAPTPVAPEAPKPAVETVVVPKKAAAPPAPTYDFSTPKKAYHSTRVIGDEVGLTVAQKDILCACIYQESNFLTNPRPNQNKDKNGKVWSTDYGIVQINDYYNIGPGKVFPSVNYVLSHPDVCVRWMAKILKKTGKLQPWASYTSGAYKKWLSTGSPMWKLK